MKKIFELILWNARFIVLSGVISSLCISIAMFYITTVDTFYTLKHILHYASSSLDAAARIELRTSTIAHVVEVIDGFLLAAVLFIFATGLYELFISKIDIAEANLSAKNVLHITSLDQLKNRLAKVILMIMIVSFFEYVLKMQFTTPEDLLYLSSGIALIGLALYLTHKSEVS